MTRCNSPSPTTVRPVVFFLAAASVFLAQLQALADETAPSPCGKSFIVSGDIRHNETLAGIRVRDAAKPGIFAEDVSGSFFSAYVAGLPEGRYAVDIYLAETQYQAAGMRLMDIAAGRQKLAENFDLFATVGFARQHVVHAIVDHAEDSINGPLSIAFQARRGEAKVNAIEIMDPPGQVLACVVAT